MIVFVHVASLDNVMKIDSLTSFNRVQERYWLQIWVFSGQVDRGMTSYNEKSSAVKYYASWQNFSS